MENEPKIGGSLTIWPCCPSTKDQAVQMLLTWFKLCIFLDDIDHHRCESYSMCSFPCANFPNLTFRADWTQTYLMNSNSSACFLSFFLTHNYLKYCFPWQQRRWLTTRKTVPPLCTSDRPGNLIFDLSLTLIYAINTANNNIWACAKFEYK